MRYYSFLRDASWILVIVIITVGCQKSQNSMESMDSEAPGLIQAKNGDLYSVNCLRENAAMISAQGASAMESCKVNLSLLPADGARGTRGWNPDYIVYYPPTYYSPSYQTSSTNSFCSYAFGNNWNNNCFPLFGYNYSYSYYYAPDCSGCLWFSRSNGCRNRCYSNSFSYSY